MSYILISRTGSTGNHQFTGVAFSELCEATAEAEKLFATGQCDCLIQHAYGRPVSYEIRE
jgi:hypothetical protein